MENSFVASAIFELKNSEHYISASTYFPATDMVLHLKFVHDLGRSIPQYVITGWQIEAGNDIPDDGLVRKERSSWGEHHGSFQQKEA